MTITLPSPNTWVTLPKESLLEPLTRPQEIAFFLQGLILFPEENSNFVVTSRKSTEEELGTITYTVINKVRNKGVVFSDLIFKTIYGHCAFEHLTAEDYCNTLGLLESKNYPTKTTTVGGVSVTYAIL